LVRQNIQEMLRPFLGPGNILRLERFKNFQHDRLYGGGIRQKKKQHFVTGPVNALCLGVELMVIPEWHAYVPIFSSYRPRAAKKRSTPSPCWKSLNLILISF
jgi:hypothetical protein